MLNIQKSTNQIQLFMRLVSILRKGEKQMSERTEAVEEGTETHLFCELTVI